MKLKRILAGILTGAMMITGIPAFGLENAAAVSVYADQNDLEATGTTEYTNIALGKTVKTSGVSGTDGETGAAAVDDNTATKWVSADLRQVSPQWIQIDLGENTTSVERIEIVYDGDVWDQPYEIQTFDSEKNTQRHTVRDIGAAGPTGGTTEEPENRNPDTKTDTIRRNADNKKIILNRYVNFLFSTPGSGTGEKRVSIAEIRIFGRETRTIFGPKVKMTAPVDGAYPKIAEVLASEDHEAVYHDTLADRATPAASFMRQDGTDVNWNDVQRQIGVNDQTTVTAPQWDFTEDKAVGKLTDDEVLVQDGVLGFNAQVHTPGTVNKFDIWREDVAVISFQLLLKSFPVAASGGNTQRHLFAKGNKYSCSLNGNKIVAAMNNPSWIETKYTIPNEKLNHWMDILMVIDGHGYLRLYVDGVRATENSGNPNGGAFLHSGEPAGGFKPFSFCYSEAADRTGGNKGQIVTEKTFLKKSEGYLARFKFYTNKDNNGLINGAGTDITEAKTLSDDFVTALNIQTLENGKTGDALNDVGTIVTNMLQKEEPTARVTLCPYSRSTVWSKKGTAADANWEEMAATDTFENEVKYKATTILKADDGFAFDTSSIENVLNNLETGVTDDSAKSTVKLSDRDRVLTIVTYYNCAAEDVEETCHIDDLSVASDPIQISVNETVSIGAKAIGVGKCGNHEDADVEYTYALQGAENRVTLDETAGTLTGVKSTKGVMGYDPVTLTVTATLMKDNQAVQANNVDVKISKTISVQVVPEEAADEEIEVAPSVTVQSPKAGEFPQVAEIAIPEDAKHFEDIADRMNPAATLEPLTKDYINNSIYIHSKPTTEWTNAWENTPVIKNVDGVWAFNAQGQTPGDTNKFDVFGRDIKLVSFKLYLKKWPTSPNETISVYGKGNKYALQITNDQKLIMFMHATSGWPQEDFVPADKTGFLNKWHNIFMVVDGKGWQRLYVDGVPSVTPSGRPAQGGAFALETSGADKKPFSLGYNPNDNRPNWYSGMFTEEYGYIADFEFYSDKNYDNIVNGAGTDISEAQVLDEQLTENIDLEELERDYGDNVGIVLTNMLQESNATANITVTPYVAKTNWSQETSKGSNQFELIDKKNPTAFGYAARYRSTTTLTAYDGFVFKNDTAFKDSVKAKFATEGGAAADDIQVNVKENAKGESNKVLEIVATYGETEEAPCTCDIEVVTPPSPVSIEIPENADTATGALPSISQDDVRITCLKEEHPLSGRVLFTWAVADGDEDKIEINQSNQIVAKKAGTAKLKLTATFQTQVNGEWTTYQNDDEEDVTTTIDVTVNVTKEGAASTTEKNELNSAASTAKTNYPDSVEDDYLADEWQELQNAITAAQTLAANPNATSAQVTNAKNRIEAAITALASAKSPKGIAKDALKAVLDDAELKALIEGNNSDKKYTADSFGKLTAAYEDAESKLATADEATLKILKTTLETAWKTGLVLATPGGGNGGGGVTAGVKDGDVLPGADGSQYKVASAKDKTVIITKGVDAKKVTVGPTVVLKGDTYKVVGIGNSAFAGLKKATKVIINANVESIGDQAFTKSKKLKNVTIGANVTKIGKKAFFNCPKLNKVILKGTGLTNKSFGKQAFKKTAKKVAVKWGKVKGKQRTQLKKALKKAGMKVK